TRVVRALAARSSPYMEGIWPRRASHECAPCIRGAINVANSHVRRVPIRRPMGSCKATSTSGRPCDAPALTDQEYCLWHHPDREAERQAASAKGGSAPRRIGADLGNVLEDGPKSLRSLEAVAAANESVIGGVLSGRISQDRGRVMITGLRLQAQVLESIDAAKI